MKDLQNRVVLVTGAASGIGRECALAFAAQGAKLVISDLDAKALEGLRAQIAATGASCLACRCDVASAAGFAPVPNMSAYAASKHAVVGLSEVLAQELHDSPISVLVVCPGVINTAIVHVSPSAGFSDAQVRKLQTYYAEKGCHPRVVAADVVSAVRRGKAFLFTGPGALPGYLAMRLSRRLGRWMNIAAARQVGYLAE